jgi:membrane-bound metal-dependent hydrolase YbcI (DUF457 family)
MLLWFVGTAIVAVWLVFRDPSIDLRIVILGALAPDLIDAPFGGARFGHSMMFAAAVLSIVMLATRARRALRRRLVMGTVGLMLHLVFDGVVATTNVFWWPLGGDWWPDAQLPSVQRGWWNVALELLGLAACVWAYRRFGWRDKQRRRLLWSSGRLDRSVV